MIMSDMSVNRTGVFKLWVLNFVANAGLVVAGYFWLLIPEARGWQVAGSLVLAVIVVSFGLWLRAGTFTWFRVAQFRGERNIWPAYRRALSHVPALGFWALGFVLLAWAIWEIRAYVPQFAVWLRQKIGGVPPPRNIMNDLNWLLALVVFFVMPAIWIPIAMTVSSVGVQPQHLVRSRRVWRRPLYWLWLALLVLVAVYVPYRLVWWVPELPTLRQQLWSMGARFLLGYLVDVTAFLAAVWMVGLYTGREDPLAL
jgi:hypothetical protein